MKRKILKLNVILFALAIFVAGCNVNKEELTEGVPLSELDKAPQHLVSKEELPKFVTDMLWWHSAVYKGKWNGRTVYWIYVPLSSCYMCFVYYENGEHIDLSDVSVSINFTSTSKNWVLIYLNPHTPR